MWDIDLKYLQKDEVVEYTDRPSMLSCIFSYVCVGLMAFISIIIIILAGLSGGILGILITLKFVVLFVVLAVPSIYIILKRLSTRYAISNRGLLLRTGIITNSIKTVPFKHITSIEVKETIIGRIYRYAHLLIDTSGSGRAIEFQWKYVGSAHKVKKLIEKHVGSNN